MRFKALAKLISGIFILGLIFFSLNSNGADAAWRNMANNSGHDNLSSSGWLQNYDMALDSSGNPYLVWAYDASAGAGTEMYVYFSKWTPGVGWTKMDGTLGNDVISAGLTVSNYPQIKIDSNNIPYVVWKDNSTGSVDLGDWKIVFRKWTIGAGSSVCGAGVNDCWTNMAGTIAGNEVLSGGAGFIYFPQLALDSLHKPYITWSETDATTYYSDVFFTRWDGSKWAQMDGSAGYEKVTNSNSNNDNNYLPGMLLDSSNNPNLSWLSFFPTPGQWQIFFSKWTPSACGGSGCWTQMDGTPGTENVSNSSAPVEGWYSSNTNFKLDSANRPYVAWLEFSDGAWNTYLSKWTSGVGWTKMDGTLGHEIILPDNSGGFNMLFDGSNNLEIAWQKSPDLFFKKWIPGTGWTKADGTLGYDQLTNYGLDYEASAVKMVLSSSGQPNICWVTYNMNTNAMDIFFSKWSGTAWVTMDGTAGHENISNTGTVSDNNIPGNNIYAFNSVMQLNSADEPFFGWLDYANGAEYEAEDLFFTRWTTSSGLSPLTGEVTLTAEVEPSLTLTLTSTACDLGSFDSANLKTCSYGAEVSTNGSAGYTALINSDGNLRNATNSIANVSGGSVTPATENYGLSTTKSSQTISQINDANSDTFYTQADCTALNNQGSTAMTASALTTSEQTFASSGGPVAADTTYLCHAVAITGTTPAGAYSQLVTITAIGNF